MHISSKAQTDLTDVPSYNPDLALFAGGSSHSLQGQQQTGCAVVSWGQVTEAEPLPARMSTQVAELVALMHAAHMEGGKSVNICIDSCYAFGICHATGVLQEKHGF